MTTLAPSCVCLHPCAGQSPAITAQASPFHPRGPQRHLQARSQSRSRSVCIMQRNYQITIAQLQATMDRYVSTRKPPYVDHPLDQSIWSTYGGGQVTEVVNLGGFCC